MKPRPVTIHGLELLDWRGREADFLIECSSGTYIRSLARDMALAAGSRASLLTLSRESIGPILLSEALAPEDFRVETKLRVLDPGLAIALGLRPRVLSEQALARFRQGGRIDLGELSDPSGLDLPAEDHAEAEPAKKPSAIFSARGDFLGLVDELGTGVKYRFVCGGEA